MPPSEPDEKTTKAERGGAPDGAPRLLVVDDEPEVRTLLRRVLTGAGYAVREAGDGSEALRVLESMAPVCPEYGPDPVDLVITDIQMPHLRGDVLQRRIRERYPEAAVILITAFADVEMAIGCMREGASDYILKPFSIADVAVRVRRALELRALRRGNRQHQTRYAAQTERLRALAEPLLASLEAGDLADAIDLARQLHAELGAE